MMPTRSNWSLSALAGRAFLIASLVLAQQVAMWHQLWHVAKTSSQHASVSLTSESQAAAGFEQQLCEFHASLGTVLGVLASAPGAPHCSKSSNGSSLFATGSAVYLPALLPFSTGPPLSSSV